MPAIKAVLFDVYETLLHNESSLWEATFEEICHAQALAIDAMEVFREWRTHERAFRKGRVNLDNPSATPPFRSYYEAWRDCFRIAFERLKLAGNAAAAAQAMVYALAKRQPYQDALAAMPHIQRRWRTGIVSNADDLFLLPSLRNAGMEFEVILSSEQGRAYKPDPSLFKKGLELIGTEAAETVYVGDAPFEDVLGSRLAGIPSVWLNRDGKDWSNSFWGEPSGRTLPTPDYEIRDLRELIPALEG